jgi:hypothetical protein
VEAALQEIGAGGIGGGGGGGGVGLASVATPTAVAYVDSQNVTGNFNGSQPILGNTWGTASFTRFVIVDIPTAPYVGREVVLAELHLYRIDTNNAGATDRVLEARRILRQDLVMSEVTWNQYKSGSNWTTAGARSVGNDIDTERTKGDQIGATADTDQWHRVDVTKLLRDALAAGDSRLLVIVSSNVDGFGSNLVRFEDVADANGPKLHVLTDVEGGSAAIPEEVDYAEVTSQVSITATTEGAATTVVAGAAVTYDGATEIVIEAFLPYVAINGVANDVGQLVLYDGSTSLGKVETIHAQVTGVTGTVPGVHVRRKLTPSAGSHTYSIRGYKTSGSTFIAGGGAGGSGNIIPGFLRITRPGATDSLKQIRCADAVLSVLNATWTAVTPSDAEETFDDGGWHSGTSATFTVPAGINRVKAMGSFRTSGVTAGHRYIRWIKNGTQIGGSFSMNGAVAGGNGAQIHFSDWFVVAPGDTVGMEVYQDSGGTVANAGAEVSFEGKAA